MAKASKGTLKALGMDLIDEPGGVIRLEIEAEEVESLARNIEEVGLLQPIVVRPKGDRYEIVVGHRRFLAFKSLGREKIPANIRRLDDLDCAVARASENLRRVDLSPIEEAASYADLHEQHGLTYEQIGERMGKSAGVIKRRLDLLKMPPQLQQAVHRKQISYGVAEELFRLGSASRIDYYLGYAIDHGVTVAVARQWVNDEKKAERSGSGDVGGSGGGGSPLESSPVYVSCDLCRGPVEVSEVHYVKCCGGCIGSIRKALEGS